MFPCGCCGIKWLTSPSPITVSRDKWMAPKHGQTWLLLPYRETLCYPVMLLSGHISTPSGHLSTLSSHISTLSGHLVSAFEGWVDLPLHLIHIPCQLEMCPGILFIDSSQWYQTTRTQNLEKLFIQKCFPYNAGKSRSYLPVLTSPQSQTKWRTTLQLLGCNCKCTNQSMQIIFKIVNN